MKGCYSEVSWSNWPEMCDMDKQWHVSFQEMASQVNREHDDIFKITRLGHLRHDIILARDALLVSYREIVLAMTVVVDDTQIPVDSPNFPLAKSTC